MECWTTFAKIVLASRWEEAGEDPSESCCRSKQRIRDWRVDRTGRRTNVGMGRGGGDRVEGDGSKRDIKELARTGSTARARHPPHSHHLAHRQDRFASEPPGWVERYWSG